MATSNFTFGAGNPLNTAVDPYNPPPAPPFDPLKSMTSTPPPTTPFGQAGGNTGTVNSSATPADPAYDAQMAIWNAEDAPAFAADAALNATLAAEDKKPAYLDDAFSQMQMILESYGLSGMADTLGRMMAMGLSANAALVKLKYDTTIDPATGKSWNNAYTVRFSGNSKRVANGLNALSEAEYISNEKAYAETLRAYGLSNLLSTDRNVNQTKFADYIANDVSSTEFNDRISTVVDNVVNADPAVMEEFRKYYGTLTTNDLVSYFLSPKETLPILKQKATAAGISAESFKQGLGSDTEARAMELSKLGITADQARVGYGNIGEVLPESQKLSSIYKEAGINYDKTAGENEFLLNNATAQRKRKQLSSMERAQFSGDAGLKNATSLSSSKQGNF